MTVSIAISVIVTTCDRAGLLPECLASLLAQTLDPARYEVLVVDNACSDGTAALVREFVARDARIRLVRQPAAGRSRALNTGVGVACGTYVALLDDDARASPTWLARIIDAFETVRPEPPVVGGRIVARFERPPPPWLDPGEESIEYGDTKGVRRHPLGYSGSNVAVRRDVIVAHDGFSTACGPRGRRFRVGEDLEFFARVFSRHPESWYDPAIRVQRVIPAWKLTVRYRLRRAYWNGLAQSQIADLRLLSREGARLARKVLSGAARPDTGHGGFRPTDPAARRMHRWVKRAERAAYRVGRILGARVVGAGPRGGS